jgi:hypothetical protein
MRNRTLALMLGPLRLLAGCTERHTVLAPAVGQRNRRSPEDGG